MVYFLFILGFIALIKGAGFLVTGASSIAKKLYVSDLAIGITVVSFGTTMPELVVNIIATSEGKAGLAVGNIFGSNIANMLLILGTAALVKPLPIDKKTIFHKIPYLIFAAVMVGFLANFSIYENGAKKLYLNRTDGLVLIAFFWIFLVYIFFSSRHKDLPPDATDISIISIKRSLLYIFVGMLGLFFGGSWIVEGAVAMAKYFGMSENFIGLTIVAIGTSLPELVTSVTAIKQGRTDVAVGNVIGANVLNLLWVLGICAAINPLPFNPRNNIEIGVIILSTAMLLLGMFTGGRRVLDRLEGGIFVTGYICYIIYLMFRG